MKLSSDDVIPLQPSYLPSTYLMFSKIGIYRTPEGYFGSIDQVSSRK
jgi:hypothetical protein